MDAILSLEHISLTIEHSLVLDDLSLSISPGEFYYLNTPPKGRKTQNPHTLE